MQPLTVTLPDGFTISDDRARLDLPLVHEMLEAQYWMSARKRATTERSIAHCLCLGIYAPERQVGFGRVVTDYATRAHLADIVIDPGCRGRGLGKALVETMLSHPELSTVTQWTLTTRDAQDLYARFGFEEAAQPGWMTRSLPPARPMKA